MAVLEVIDLKKHFHLSPGFLSGLVSGAKPRIIKAVDGVSFSLEEGEVLGIAGESGCGKSSCCLTIAKLQDPTGGTVLYRGKDIGLFRRAELREYRRRVQIIFQDPYESLNPRFTTFDLVAEPLRALRIGGGKDTERAVIDTLSMVGLEPKEYRDRYPHQMSGGERQRVGIAQALVLEPELVIADEPLSMLDVSIRAGILDLIRDLSRRMNFSCIYVSHDLSILSNISERMMIMYLGKVMELGDTKALIRQPLHPYARALISAVPIPDPNYKRPVPDIRGDISRPVNPPPGCRFQDRCPEVSDTCRAQEPVLREIEPGRAIACHLY